MYIRYYYCLRTNTFFLKGFDWTVVLCDLCCVLAGRKRAIRTLKPSFFVSGVVGTFVGDFVELRDFSSVVRSMEVWPSSMRGELVFSERVLSYPKCQVIHVLFVSFSCVVFVKVGSCLLVRVCSC